MLAVEDSADINTIHNILHDISPAEIISSRSALVMFQNFSEIEYISVSTIKERVDVDDVRYTPYLRNIPRYFFISDAAGKAYHVFYIRRTQSMLAQYLQLRSLFAPRNIQWSLIGFSFYLRAITLGAFFAVVIYLSFFQQRKLYLLSFFSALPLGFLAGLGGIPVLAMSSVLYISWLRVLLVITRRNIPQDQRWIRDLGKRSWLQYAVFVALSLIILAVANPALILQGLLPVLLALLSIAGFVNLLHFREEKKHEHHLFLSVNIVSEPVRLQNYIPDPPISYLLLHVILFLVLLFVPADIIIGTHVFPAPDAVVNRNMPQHQRIRQLWENSKTEDLPNISDYLAHAALHESLLFRTDFEYYLPELDSEIMISRFFRENGQIMQQKEAVFSFDERWFQQKLQLSPWPSLHNLLLEQSGYPSIGLKQEKEYNYTMFKEVFVVLLVCSAFPLMLKIGGESKRNEKYDDVFLISMVDR